MLTIGIDYASKEPIYEQIYIYIREEIKNGNLIVNTKLPSSRGLANHLSISRNTVDMAYAQLQSEGYIESIPKRGYFVNEIEDIIYIPKNEPENILNKTIENNKYLFDFSPMGVDMSNFPYNKWRKLMKDCMIDDNSQLFQAGHHQGDEDFREIIKMYLHQSRGVVCDANQIIIGAGSDYLLLLLSKIFHGNRIVAMENPSYKQAYKIFDSIGYKVNPISVGAGGIDVEELEDSDSDIAYVTPSHQFPMGTVMPINNRIKLLRWAKSREDRYIIEDDYDSEFRYSGKPIPSLQSNVGEDKVIYIGTLSKAIAPAIRLGYMVLPKNLMEIYKQRADFYFSTVSRIDQTIVGKFIQDGYFERHLNKMRGIYKAKHDILIQSLKNMNMDFVIKGESAGLHLLLEFDEKYSEQLLIDKASSVGVKVYGLSDYYIREKKHKPTIILGFARLSGDDIQKGIELLEKAWKNIYN